MCGQTLWRALLPPAPARRRRRQPIVEPQFQNVLCGSWAAILFREGEQELVIAADVGTWLTSVCRFERGASFRAALANAVAITLEDVGADRSTIALELTMIEHAPLVRLTDATIVAELGYISATCGIELCYPSDLRRVQRNLNELPHGGREIPVPADAAAALLAARASRPATH